MSSTDVPSMAEDSEMLESDGEKVVTMMDVLQEQQDFEDDANAVLGASDEKNCTYPKGYIKRQAVFACLTCTEAKTDPTKRAGVCLACSLSCHENHEVIELYTKRNFCCDCGNPKFNSNPCQFLPQKPDMNVNNSYNQNFSGLYCTCHRPYPDPDSTFEDEMIQCIVCEDWLHASHLEAVVPPNEQYSEMICKACMQKNEFLYDYSDLAVNVDIEIDMVSINGTEPSMCNGNTDRKEIAEERKENDLEVEVSETHKSAELSIEDKKETSDKPAESHVDVGKEIADMTTDLAYKKESDEMHSTETDTNNKEMSDINPNDSSEPVSKTDCEIAQNNTDTSMEVEQTEQNGGPDEPSDSTKVLEGNDSAIASETSVTDTDVPENKDLKNDSLTESSTDDKSETVTEQKNREETNMAEQSSIINEKNFENKVNTEIKDSENIEQNVAKENIESTDASKETQHDEPKDDVLENIDKIINEDNDDSSTNVAADKAKAEEESTKKTESDSKDNVDDNDKLEIKESDADDIMAASKKTSIEANEDETTQNDKEKSSEIKRKLDENINVTAVKKAKFEDTKNCKRPRDPKKKLKGAAFWPSNFRQMLCTCNECLTMYKDLSVLFLIDPEDTVTAYEMLGKEMTEAFGASQYEKGLKALSSLDRIQQINALTEYNKMRDKLLEFLKSFKDRQEIVKEEDIKAFFAGMKPKREPDGVYFCR